MNGKATHSDQICCHVCGQNNWELLYDVKDTNQNVPGAWSIVRCSACGLGMLDPMPSSDDIEKFYADQFYADDGYRFNPLVERLRAVMGSGRKKTLIELMPNGKKLLDFGSGAGHFAAAMEKAGWEVESVDIAGSSGRKKELLNMDGERPILNFSDDTFDAVTLWYVIEHMRSPRKVLEEMRRILRPGGILVLAQQNFSSAQARFFGPRWLILDPPRHLYQFNPANLNLLAETMGFRCITVKHGSLEMGPFTILQSILNLFLGNRNYLFCHLKSRRLRKDVRGYANSRAGRIMAYLSLSLAIFLSPLSLLAYYVLLARGSGDVFTLYLKK